MVTRQRLRPFLSPENHEDLVELAGLADVGVLNPVIEHTHPLTPTASAMERVATCHARGKVVITV